MVPVGSSAPSNATRTTSADRIYHCAGTIPSFIPTGVEQGRWTPVFRLREFLQQPVTIAVHEHGGVYSASEGFIELSGVQV